jgi:hypothetical protein
MRKNTNLSPVLWAAFVRELARHHGKKSYTINELAERFEISQTTAWKWIKTLHENELVFVLTWVARGKVWVASYAWGFKHADAPKTKPMTDTEYSRRWRQKKRTGRVVPLVYEKNPVTIHRMDV